MRAMQHVIVGNGIVALSTAFRLAQRLKGSDTVTVIGPCDRPGAATMAAAAMLNSFAEISAYSLKSKEDRYHFALSRRAAQQWPDFEKELVDAARGVGSACDAISRGEQDRGTYIINNTAADEWDDKNFDAMVKALEDFKEPFTFVHPGEIPNYLPAQHERAARAIYIPDEGWLNPRIVIETLDTILSGHDRVTVIDGEARRFRKSGDAISGVELADGTVVEGDAFLLATGASASALLDASDLGIAMQPVFYGLGVSIEIRSEGHPHTKCVRTTNRGGACGIYSVPLFLGKNGPKDHLVIGASNRVINKPVLYGRLSAVEHLMRSAMQEINGHFYAADLVRVNVGWRPTSQDTYPLLGKTSVGNLCIATGTKRDGFHLSPVLSDIMATLMTGGSAEKEFDMFAPERKVIRDIPRQDAVEMIVNSLMSEQYQHGYNPSNVLMNAQVRETYRKDIEALHDRIGAKDWGIHPELVNMYREGHAK
ncbi:MAG: FAD dependent oxidoreductase [Candidatus Peregrinibacteria bacterium Gr01-1014_25]|nr:MAG: FAD dependent oxidoreductase [Candidatus Peregrinibacteria bacterium Gr01-1014_25]